MAPVTCFPLGPVSWGSQSPCPPLPRLLSDRKEVTSGLKERRWGWHFGKCQGVGAYPPEQAVERNSHPEMGGSSMWAPWNSCHRPPLFCAPSSRSQGPPCEFSWPMGGPPRDPPLPPGHGDHDDSRPLFYLQHSSTLGSVFGDSYYEQQMAARQANALSHQVSGCPGTPSKRSPGPCPPSGVSSVPVSRQWSM